MVVEHGGAEVAQTHVGAQGHVHGQVLDLHRRVRGVHEQNVLRLDVRMNHADLMQSCTRSQQLLGNVTDVVLSETARDTHATKQVMSNGGSREQTACMLPHLSRWDVC